MPTSGGVGRPPAIGGSKLAPSLGGGFSSPGYGLTFDDAIDWLMIVVRLPDSKIAA